MSKELIESIINKDLVSAKNIFESRIEIIREKKLYEAKKQLQAEAFGGKSPEQVRSQPNYRGRAADVLGPSPYDTRFKPKKTKTTKTTKTPKVEPDMSVLKKDVEKKNTSNRPGIIKRNVNTLLGRKPGFVPSKVPDDEKGGRVGKVVRKTATVAGKGVLGIAKGIASDIAGSI